MNFNIRATAGAFKQQALHFFADPQWVIPSLIAPFVFTVVALMIFRSTEGPVVLYAVLGGGILGMWGNTLYSSSWSINFDRMNGTIEPLMVSPTPVMHVVAGRSLWNALLGLLNALLVFLIAELAFQADVRIQDPLLFFFALVTTLVSLALIGLMFSALFVLTRKSFVFTRMLEFPIYVACGAMFPLTFLPEWSMPFSAMLAPSWGVDALRIASLEGYETVGLGYWGDMAIILVLSVVYLLITIRLYRSMERRALISGTLGRY
jgi:ABC-2 type transport system permease protein